MTFCSAAENFQVKILGFELFRFLVTVKKPVFSSLGAATCAQDVGVGAEVAGASTGVPCDWVIACWR